MGHRDITAVLSVETLPNVRHGSKLAILLGATPLGLIFLGVVAFVLKARVSRLQLGCARLGGCIDQHGGPFHAGANQFSRDVLYFVAVMLLADDLCVGRFSQCGSGVYLPDRVRAYASSLRG